MSHITSKKLQTIVYIFQAKQKHVLFKPKRGSDSDSLIRIQFEQSKLNKENISQVSTIAKTTRIFDSFMDTI